MNVENISPFNISMNHLCSTCFNIAGLLKRKLYPYNTSTMIKISILLKCLLLLQMNV